MENEFNRLVMLLQAVYDQGSMVHKDPKMRQVLKMKFRNFDSQVKGFLDEIHKSLGNDQNVKDYLEEMSILFNETLREVERCKDPKVAVQVLAAINEGCEVIVDGVTIRDYQPNKQKAA